MKAKAKKPTPRARTQPVAKKSAPPGRNGFSSPHGYRDVEMEWMNKHPEKFRPLAGQYVIVEGRRIVAHSADAAVALETARRRGVRIPFIFFLPPPLPKNTFWIGP